MLKIIIVFIRNIELLIKPREINYSLVYLTLSQTIENF